MRPCCRCSASHIRSRTWAGPGRFAPPSARKITRIGPRPPTRNSPSGSPTPVEFCSAKPPPPNSACVRPPRAVCVRPREIPGTSNIPPAAPAAAPPLPSPPDCIPWRRAATAVDRFAYRLHAAAWSESNRRVGESRALRRRAKHGPDFPLPAPIARTVRDAALMLDAMAGMMPGDPYAARPPARPFVEEVPAHPKKLRLAVINHSAHGPVEAETLAALESACGVFREMGHRVEPLTLDPGAMLGKYARVIVGASVSALNIPNPDLLDPVVRGSYDWGAKISAADYIRAVTAMHNTSDEIVHAPMSHAP